MIIPIDLGISVPEGVLLSGSFVLGKTCYTCTKHHRLSLPAETDVLIIGAGPAGAAAALFLAQKNISCTVVDKEQFPRDKVCGDALSGKTVEVLNRLDKTLAPGLANHSAFLGSHGVIFSAPNGESLRVPFLQNNTSAIPPGFMARRMDFDNLLVEQLKSKRHISLSEKTEIRHYDMQADGVKATTTKGEVISARLVIAADGANSSFAKNMAQLPTEAAHNCFGLRAYYRGVKQLDAENFIELHFLKEILPCYFWIFPLPGGMANVGMGIRASDAKKKGIHLKQVFEKVIQEHPVIRQRFENAERIGEVKLASLPLGTKKRPVSGQRFMLCGDAAQLIDPFTGEGIGNAMWSGMLAAGQAEKCLEANDFSPAFMQAYDEQLYHRLWPELKLSARLCSLVNFPGLFNLVVRKASRNPVLGETISCMFNDLDIRARLKSPSFYWKLLFA